MTLSPQSHNHDNLLPTDPNTDFAAAAPDTDSVADTDPAASASGEEILVSEQRELPTTEQMLSALPDQPADFTFTGDLGNNVTRPLTQEAVADTHGLAHVVFAQASDLGRVRTNNEDAVYSFFATGRSADDLPDFGLFVVADGLGGHQDGEKASALAVRALAQFAFRHLYLPLLQGEREYDNPINELIGEAILKAHSEIQQRVPRGSTTCSAVIMIADIAYIAHVGDSRIYLAHKGTMEQITRDHSVVQRLIELDHITAEEASSYHNRNYLYRALGQSEELEVDTLRRRLPPNSRLILCSDGLWGQVSETEILAVLEQTPHIQEACFRLVALANIRGGSDNVSVVIVQSPK